MPAVDVIVVGLGAMGSAAAAHLATRGQRVLGVEQFTPAHDRGSSHGETRIVRQAYFEHPNYVPLARRSYELWDELGVRVGQRLRHEHGGLMLGAADSAVVTGTLASAHRWSLPHERLNRAAMAQRFPQFHLRPGDEGVFEAIAGYVSPEDGVRAHLGVATAAGADLRFGTRVAGWDVDPVGVAVDVDGERWSAERLVLATGAWAAAALHDAGAPLALRPVRRVIGYFEPDDPAAFTPERFPVYVFQTSSGDAIYGFPETVPGRGAKVGFHYRGPDVDPDLLDRTVNADEIDELRTVLAERIPGLAGRCVDASVCMYTMTPDEHFVIGLLPGTHERVVVAAGFSGHGYKFAPVVGEILADLTTTGATAYPIEFLTPTRSAVATH